MLIRTEKDTYEKIKSGKSLFKNYKNTFLTDVISVSISKNYVLKAKYKYVPPRSLNLKRSFPLLGYFRLSSFSLAIISR
jgi:hypothetical protein